jgi:glutamate--cysteine ligase
VSDAARARAAWVEDRVRAQCFGVDGEHAGGPLTVGAELELLAFDAGDRSVARIAGEQGSLEVVRDVARRLGWREQRSPKGVPRFLSDGGSLTFEPGGQLEYASGVHNSVDGVLRELCTVETALRDSASRVGITLVARGVDPFNGPDAVPLQLDADRYARMARYFATIGADGARMMRQTASLQINLGGVPLLERWSVANALAPWLVALFGNSSCYAGAPTGCASYRAETWRGVDPSRTGVFRGDDPVREYAAFALQARAFLADDTAPAFAHLDESLVTEEALATHLTTLFPEVRPRGYLECRSTDAVDTEARRTALAFTAGILGDAAAARDASALIGAADPELLRSAGRLGVRDARIHSAGGDLVGIARDGCARLGTSVVSEEAREAMYDSLHDLLRAEAAATAAP